MENPIRQHTMEIDEKDELTTGRCQFITTLFRPVYEDLRIFSLENWKGRVSFKSNFFVVCCTDFCADFYVIVRVDFCVRFGRFG
ncbi:MAG: hypothetical protein ACPHKR_10955, partial [bacterium]